MVANICRTQTVHCSYHLYTLENCFGTQCYVLKANTGVTQAVQRPRTLAQAFFRSYQLFEVFQVVHPLNVGTNS